MSKFPVLGHWMRQRLSGSFTPEKEDLGRNDRLKLIAALYHYDIYLEPVNEYTSYLLTEIWIRPTITYGLVACFVSETQEK